MKGRKPLPKIVLRPREFIKLFHVILPGYGVDLAKTARMIRHEGLKANFVKGRK